MKKIFSLLTLCLFFAVSCNDNFLDKKPLDKLSEDAVFGSEALAESYINGLYVVLGDPFTEANLSCITDEGFFRYGGTSTRFIADGSMTPDNVMYIDEGGYMHNTRNVILNIWNRTYQYIYNANYFINYVTDPERGGDLKISEEAKTRLLGETYFLRAWSYFHMILRYGGVPIITKNYGLEDDFRVARNNFDECVEFIKGDLDIAEQMLPDKSKAVKGRINKDIARALRGRLLLVAASPLFNDPTQPDNCLFRGKYDKQKWQDAYDANKVMVDRADVEGAYALDATYAGVWCTDNSPEVIWGKYFPQSGFMNKAQLLYSVEYFNGWTSLEPTQAMVMDYEMKNGKKFFEEGSGYDPKKPFANRDPRFYYSIAYPFSNYINTDDDGTHDNELLLYLQYKDKTVADFAYGMKEPDPTAKAKHLWHQTSTTGMELNKWYIPTRKISDDETGTILYPWFRLAEFYLNLAECAYMLGKEDECRTYINKIRSRADVQMPEVTESGESLWDRLVNERRIELAFETFRYFDVRRWKIAPAYESINFAGMRTMLLDRGTQIDTIYRVVRPYDESKNNTCYYWSTAEARNTYKNNAGEDIATIITYRWLGKEYKIDFGDCCLNISPTPKLFPQERPQGPSYLKDGVVVSNQPINDGVVYPNYLMPIPRNEMLKSEGELEQNPGY